MPTAARESGDGSNNITEAAALGHLKPPEGLDGKERDLFSALLKQGIYDRAELELSQAFYLGEQVIDNLRIAVPKELEKLRTVVGWAAIAVDPLVERLAVDSFRLPGTLEADTRLQEQWIGNDLDSAQSDAFTDALSMGRAYWMAGTPESSDEPARITVESPLNLTVKWDLRGDKAEAALQRYYDGPQAHAAFMLPNVTYQMAFENHHWKVYDEDRHDLGFVPVVRMVNRRRTVARDGASEITKPLRSVISSACRTLLGLEVAREIYSVPQRVILGASEQDFQKSDGSAKSAWETYITSVLGLERDESGELPDIKQLQVYDPATFTKLIEMYASQAAGILSAPAQDLGLYTDGNPTSADAVTAYEARRNRRAEMRQREFGDPIARVMKYGLALTSGGRIPAEYERVAVDWQPVMQEPLDVASEALSKQVKFGMVPPTSDVVLKRLGYSAVERKQLAQDRRQFEGRQTAAQVAASLTGQQAAQPADDGDQG